MTLGIEAELNAFAVAMITDVQISIQKEGDAASAALEKKKEANTPINRARNGAPLWRCMKMEDFCLESKVKMTRYNS